MELIEFMDFHDCNDVNHETIKCFNLLQTFKSTSPWLPRLILTHRAKRKLKPSIVIDCSRFYPFCLQDPNRDVRHAGLHFDYSSFLKSLTDDDDDDGRMEPW